MFDAHGLDDRGILPYDGETEEQFVKRGNAILDASVRLKNAQLINSARSYANSSSDYFLNNLDYSLFDYDDAMRRDALAYMSTKYGMNLTWVRFFEISTDDELQNILGGVAMRQNQRLNNISVVIPVIFIREFSTRVMTHELIHASRADILESYNRFFCGDSDDIIEAYEERVAHNRFYRGNFWNNFHLSVHIRDIYRARRKLEKYFDDKAGYVFIRLSYAEATRSLFNARSPFEFIKERGDNLKFKIMAEKLGL
ncbi:MAG: hypothetical protein HZC14_02125 [Candidatus Niyogibacteria bacterium]|nr:hypothetical protein [Candidatus Niyogibacteria bacterium]